MTTHRILGLPRRERLAVGMAAALAAAGFVGCPAEGVAATTLHVTNTADGGPGSLRAAVAGVGEGGTVVLDPTLKYGSITLVTGAIEVPWNAMTLTGPGADLIAVSGGGNFRVFHHTGAGKLSISGATIADGKYQSNTLPLGGCIYSAGNVELVDVKVSSCTTDATGPNPARGGGVYARGTLDLRNSTITGNTAAGTGGNAYGGGVYARGAMTALYSAFSDNTAGTTSNYFGLGGAMWTRGNTYLLGSLVSGNKALLAGAIGSQTALGGSSVIIANSTISGNRAYFRFGGVYSKVPVTLVSSTVAFNEAPDGGAVYVVGAPVTLRSSIVADNVTNGAKGDLDGAFVPAPTGANNLITSSTIGLPPGTITACPKLGPLADNGGGTLLTHALLAGSPAINAGADPFNLELDERGTGFLRVVGGQADIGAFERQGGVDDRILVGGFESVCDH